MVRCREGVACVRSHVVALKYLPEIQESKVICIFFWPFGITGLILRSLKSEFKVTVFILLSTCNLDFSPFPWTHLRCNQGFPRLTFWQFLPPKPYLGPSTARGKGPK